MSAPSQARPVRGEVWMADVSGRALNGAPSRLATIVPLTTRDRGIRSHIRIGLGATGLRQVSFARTDQQRTVSQDRLEQRLGVVDTHTMRAIEEWLRIFLEL